MNLTLFRRLRFAAVAIVLHAVVFPLIPASRAQEKPAPTPDVPAQSATELVVSKGTFERGGQRMPATLRNVVDALVERYPRANITIVGADDVRIGDVTLRWGRRVPNSNETVPLHGVVTALKAASQHRFSIEVFGPNDFVLSGQNNSTSHRIAEVFKLGPLLAGRGSDRSLQIELERAEALMAELKNQFGDRHPRITELAGRIETLKKQQAARTDRSVEEADRLLAQIAQVIRETLERLRPGEAAPELKYHSGTGLLVVIGTEDAVDVTRKVVAALQ